MDITAATLFGIGDIAALLYKTTEGSDRNVVFCNTVPVKTDFMDRFFKMVCVRITVSHLEAACGNRYKIRLRLHCSTGR